MKTIKLWSIAAASFSLALAAGCERQRTGSGSEGDEVTAPKVTPGSTDDTVAPRQGDLREGNEPYRGPTDTEAELPQAAPSDTRGDTVPEPGTASGQMNAGSGTMGGTGTMRDPTATGTGAAIDMGRDGGPTERQPNGTPR